MPQTASIPCLAQWKLIIIYWLAQTPLHFAALKCRMQGISQKVLTQQLRELIGNDLRWKCSLAAKAAGRTLWVQGKNAWAQ